jgi:hypothetical protein
MIIMASQPAMTRTAALKHRISTCDIREDRS